MKFEKIIEIDSVSSLIGITKGINEVECINSKDNSITIISIGKQI